MNDAAVTKHKDMSEPMLGTLLLRSFERAERMYQAMLSRGSAGDYPVIAPRRFSWRDLAFLAGTALFVGYTMNLAHGWLG